MKRKVVLHGPNTLGVSIPTKWVKEQNISKGDDIDVEIKESQLIISTKKKGVVEKTTFNITNKSTLIMSYLASLYKLGYDEIKVTFKDKNVVPLIQKAISELVGYEIIKQSDYFCEIRDVAEGVPSEFNNVLRRTFILLVSMAEDSFNALDDLETLKNIHYLEKTNNRFTTLCRRILNKHGYKDSKKITFIYLIVDHLEKIADEYKHMIDHLVENKIKLTKESKNLYKETDSFLREFYELFYNCEEKKAVALNDKRDKLINTAYRLFNTKGKKELVVIHHLISIIQTIFNSITPTLALDL